VETVQDPRKPGFGTRDPQSQGSSKIGRIRRGSSFWGCLLGLQILQLAEQGFSGFGKSTLGVCMPWCFARTAVLVNPPRRESPKMLVVVFEPSEAHRGSEPQVWHKLGARFPANTEPRLVLQLAEQGSQDSERALSAFACLGVSLAGPCSYIPLVTNLPTVWRLCSSLPKFKAGGL
jgi:hypothetical protein